MNVKPYTPITTIRSVVRDLCLTARNMGAEEAKDVGLVSRVLPDTVALEEEALKLASTIAAKSPLAIQGTKLNLNYSRDHTIAEGLHYMSVWNSAMLMTEDMQISLDVMKKKETAVYNNL